MRYHYACNFPDIVENIFKQSAFRKRIYRGGRFVKYEHLGIFAVCSGNHQSLLFSARQLDSVLEKLTTVRSVQTDIYNLIIHSCFFKSRLYPIVSFIIIENQVFADRESVQNIILKYRSKYSLIGIKIVFSDILSLVADSPRCRFVESQEQFYKG